MNAQETKLQAAETDLKQLMADVARAAEKAQRAVARITSKSGHDGVNLLPSSEPAK